MSRKLRMVSPEFVEDSRRAAETALPAIGVAVCQSLVEWPTVERKLGHDHRCAFDHLQQEA
jgi:hypothetical protein